MPLPRYKYLVQVVIGENRGAGIRCVLCSLFCCLFVCACRMGCRCLWDAQTDKVAEETFVNDSLFCAAVAFGVYLY